MLSVVISTKNVASTLEECLESVFSADAPTGLEVIVVDAYSTDQTQEILKKYPVSIYFSGGGISVQRNMGWRHSKGEFILSLDADAYIEPNCLTAMLKEFENPKVGIVECYTKAVVKTWLSKAQGQLWDADFPKYSANQERKRGGGPVVMYRRRLLEDVAGYDDAQTYGADDTSLSHRAFKRGWKIVLLSDRLAYHHPRHTLKGLMKQQFGWGNGLSILWKRTPEAYQGSSLGKYTPLVGRLAGPIMAIKWAVVLRNPSFLFFYPLMQYSYVAGCLYGFLKRGHS